MGGHIHIALKKYKMAAQSSNNPINLTLKNLLKHIPTISTMFLDYKRIKISVQIKFCTLGGFIMNSW